MSPRPGDYGIEFSDLWRLLSDPSSAIVPAPNVVVGLASLASDEAASGLLTFAAGRLRPTLAARDALDLWASKQALARDRLYAVDRYRDLIKPAFGTPVGLTPGAPDRDVEYWPALLDQYHGDETIVAQAVLLRFGQEPVVAVSQCGDLFDAFQRHKPVRVIGVHHLLAHLGRVELVSPDHVWGAVTELGIQKPAVRLLGPCPKGRWPDEETRQATVAYAAGRADDRF